MNKFDKKFLRKSVKFIAGVDEAGRGPLAGPVVAAAVIFDKKTSIKEIKDSKLLTAKKREELFIRIQEKALSIGVGIIEHTEIDKINILQATLKAMKLAVKNLSIKPNLILIDGNKSFDSKIPTRTIVKGDRKSFSIAAASIIAKVTRDRIMIELSKKHPNYLWERNKGYGTKAHIQAIRKYGYTDLHRKTFLSKILNMNDEEILLD